VRTRIERREVLTENIGKGRYKIQGTTEEQKCHTHGMRGKIASADEVIRGASTQQIIVMLEHNNHGHAKYSKVIPKKPMVQRTFKQILNNIKTKSYLLRTTAENNLRYEKRRVTCPHKCKECSNQLTQHLTEQPEDRIISGKWSGIRK